MKPIWEFKYPGTDLSIPVNDIWKAKKNLERCMSKIHRQAKLSYQKKKKSIFRYQLAMTDWSWGTKILENVNQLVLGWVTRSTQKGSISWKRMLKTWRFWSFLDYKNVWKELDFYPKRLNIKCFYFFAPSIYLVLRGKESFFQTDSIVFSSNKPNEGLKKKWNIH